MLGTINAIINNLLNNVFHAVWFYALTTNPRFNKAKTALLALLSVIISEALSLFTIFNYGVESKAFSLLYIIGSLVYIIFYVFLMQKGKILKSLFIFFSYICIWAAVYVVVMIITNYVFSGWEPSVWIMRAFFNIVLLLIYHFLFKARFKSVQAQLEKPSGVLLLVSGMAYLLLPILMIFYAFSDQQKNVLILAIIGFLLVFCGVVYLLIFRFIHQMGREKEVRLIEEQNRFLLEIMQNAEEQGKMAIKIKHDEKHKNSILLGFAKEGDVDSIIRYLAKTEIDEEDIQGQKYCSSKTVDIILKTYIKKAQKNGITVQTDVKMSEDTAISEVDLVAIFGNVLENAINGCLKVDGEKRIQITAYHQAIKLIIICKNTCDGDIRFENGIPKRPQGAGTGVGISSIIMSTKKYDGEVAFSQDGNVFTCAIMLNDIKN